MSGPVTLTARDGIVRAVLDRPERGNALDDATVERLIAALEGAERDGTRLFVLEGAGRHFCTGFDLPESGADGAVLLYRFVRIEMLLQRVYQAPFVTLAVAHGRTFGAGADLFAACDRRVVKPDASFAFPGAGFGIMLGTRRLAERVGAGQARRLVRTGCTIDAAEALRIGLADAMLPTAGAEAAVADAAHLAVAGETLAHLHRITADADDDKALADLVRSAARPGLAKRIAAYRARVQAARASRGPESPARPNGERT